MHPCRPWPPRAVHLCLLICNEFVSSDEPGLCIVLIWQWCSGNSVFLLAGLRSCSPGLQPGCLLEKLGFFPPHRWCLQKESQFPVVWDGAVAPLWIPALPPYAELLFNLSSLKVHCFCSPLLCLWDGLFLQGQPARLGCRRSSGISVTIR